MCIVLNCTFFAVVILSLKTGEDMESSVLLCVGARNLNSYPSLMILVAFGKIGSL